jgi:hypothetical protein
MKLVILAVILGLLAGFAAYNYLNHIDCALREEMKHDNTHQR